MPRTLNEFEEGKNIFASKINENFNNLQLDTRDVASNLSSLSNTVTSLQSTVSTISGELAPVGTIVWYGKNEAPLGYLVCNGSAISRTDYSTLFGKIGTAFGAGDESTTFNLPDLIGKVAYGSTTMGESSLKTGVQDADHQHWMNHVQGAGSGGWYTGGQDTGDGVYATHKHSISACGLLPCIKY